MLGKFREKYPWNSLISQIDKLQFQWDCDSKNKLDSGGDKRKMLCSGFIWICTSPEILEVEEAGAQGHSELCSSWKSAWARDSGNNALVLSG